MIRFRLHKNGIGDAVCGLYTACGFSMAGHDVEFHTKFHQWLSVAKCNRLAIVDDDGTASELDFDYDGELAGTRGSGVSRVQWYASRISESFGIEYAEPVRPKISNTDPVIDPGYVLICPFSAYANRVWPLAHWRRLAIDLVAMGRRVIIAGTLKEHELMRQWFSGIGARYYWGQDVGWMLSAISNADCVIGNDSGMAHVAGMVGAPTVAIISQITGSVLYGCAPSVSFVSPDYSCAGCHFQKQHGYESLCDTACAAIMTITPRDVLKKIPAL